VRVVILNFAREKTRRQVSNQSSGTGEFVARASAFYPSISQFQEMHDIGVFDRNPLHTGSMTSSPAVPFFRDEKARLIDDPFTVSVITAFAPNMKECVLPALRRAFRGTMKNRMR
jgi:uncharacterized protein (TIGR02452 family)